MKTTVFLVRSGVTEWHRERRVVGHREIGLSEEGLRQARAVADAFRESALADIVTSPVLRAVQTAEVLARGLGGNITRDPRLADLRVGTWESMSYDDVARSPEYQRLLSDPVGGELPGGESLKQVRDRALGAVDQALSDAPAGESIAIITHGGVCRILLAHYLGMPLSDWHRIRIVPGSISVLSFRDDRGLPWVHAVGWRASLRDTL